MLGVMGKQGREENGTRYMKGAERVISNEILGSSVQYILKEGMSTVESGWSDR